MSTCSQPGCPQRSTCRCTGCSRELYCSSSCQKLDWKIHKPMCKHLKKLSRKLQPYDDVVHEITQILQNKDVKYDERLWIHLLSYALFQFGESIPGKHHRERVEPYYDVIDNHFVEIEFLDAIYRHLIQIYAHNDSLSTVTQADMMIPYLKKEIELLTRWWEHITFKNSFYTGCLNDDEINEILESISTAESILATLTVSRCQFDIAENHCQLALAYAKQYEGVKKSDLLKSAFTGYCELRHRQLNFADALIFALHAYNCENSAENPTHSKTQSAASDLIESLTQIGDFDRAEIYAQVTLDKSLYPANGVDQNSEEVAVGYFNLGHVILRKNGDLIKAEGLVRKSYQMRIQLHGENSWLVGTTAHMLANILRQQNQIGDECLKLYENFLAIMITQEGVDGANTGLAHGSLGYYYQEVAESLQPLGINILHFLAFLVFVYYYPILDI